MSTWNDVGAKTVINRYKSLVSPKLSLIQVFAECFGEKKVPLLLYIRHSDKSGMHEQKLSAILIVLAMTTIIRYSEIPSFLQEGSFFQSLCSKEQSCEIEIPEECFCLTVTVETLQDFAKLLRTTAFWGLLFIPDSVIRYCALNNFALWMEVINGEFAEVNFAQDLRIVFGNNWIGCRLIGAAMHIGRTEIVQYFAPNEANRLYAMRVAAALGRVDYLELLREHGHRWDESVSAEAARTGQLDCLKY